MQIFGNLQKICKKIAHPNILVSSLPEVWPAKMPDTVSSSGSFNLPGAGAYDQQCTWLSMAKFFFSRYLST